MVAVAIVVLDQTMAMRLVVTMELVVTMVIIALVVPSSMDTSVHSSETLLTDTSVPDSCSVVEAGEGQRGDHAEGG